MDVELDGISTVKELTLKIIFRRKRRKRTQQASFKVSMVDPRFGYDE
jgi:hypothetical protein